MGSSSGARAGGRGLHSRTIEIFDMRGIAGRFLAEGQKVQSLGFNLVRFDTAVLVRPDGYVAWVDDDKSTSLNAAVERWFGARRA